MSVLGAEQSLRLVLSVIVAAVCDCCQMQPGPPEAALLAVRRDGHHHEVHHEGEPGQGAWQRRV
jgi:hypothetical protein